MTRRQYFKAGDKVCSLTVKSDTGRRTKSGNRVLQCLCDCGKFVEVSSAHLRSGNTQSCGCRAQRPYPRDRNERKTTITAATTDGGVRYAAYQAAAAAAGVPLNRWILESLDSTLPKDVKAGLPDLLSRAQAQRRAAQSQ